jgi:hypothetical protein
MARVNIPSVGLKGDFYVVGTQIVGSVQDGLYQQVRLRERAYAISKRIPSDPNLKEGPTTDAATGKISDELSVRWKEHFVEAAQKYRGPWDFSLFLAVLLSICEQETGWANVRRGGHIEFPGTKDHTVPSIMTDHAAYQKFVATFANESKEGRVSEDYAVGPMQLLTAGTNTSLIT